MHSARILVVDPGVCPTLADIEAAAQGARVELSPEALKALGEAREAYLREARSRWVYGYCTGLGARLGEGAPCGPEGEDVVLDEHAAGAGPPAPEEWVRAFLYTRLSQLARGAAPVRPVVAQAVARALNAGVIPRVPLWGSVGASGDLAPSAHAFRCVLRGRGETLDGRPCSRALADAGLEPVELEPGEALALINNTAWSTAVAALGIARLRRVIGASLRVASWTARAAAANPEHYSPEALSLKRHPKTLEAAEAMAYQPPAGEPRLPQAPYSIRCTPQVYGAALEALDWAARQVEAEACSATENPAVAGGRVYHTCNFHAVHVAIAADTAALAASHVASIIERRIDRLMDPKVTGQKPFLATEKSSVGLMIAQYTAAALAAQARARASPHSTHTIPTSLNHEDQPSMAPNAAHRLHELADTIETLTAIEAVVASRALEAQGEQPPIPGLTGTPAEMIEKALHYLRAHTG